MTATAKGVVYDLPYGGSSNAPGYSVLASGATAAPGLPIAGADVYVGSALVLGTTAPATVPIYATHTTTAADGSFAIPGLVPGAYALTIFAPAPHVAILHQNITVVTVAAGAAGATYVITVPTLAEAAWFAQETLDRQAYAANPLVLDESALEAGRYWAAFMATNAYFAHCIPASSCDPSDTTPPPASYGSQDVNPEQRFLQIDNIFDFCYFLLTATFVTSRYVMKALRQFIVMAVLSVAFSGVWITALAVTVTDRAHYTAIRQAWNDAYVTHTIEASFVGDPTPRASIEVLREKLSRLPSGTRIYEVPGFVVQDGSEVATFHDSSLTRRSGQFIISQGNKIIASYSDKSKVTAIRAALTYYVKPGHTAPARFAGVRPSAVVP